MPNTNIPLKPEEYGKWVRLFAKYPIPVLAVLLFFMFVTAYTINFRLMKATQDTSDRAANVWKELYLKERAEKDSLKTQIIVTSGIIKGFQKSAVKSDSLVKQHIEESKPYLNIIQKTQKE